VLFRCEDRVQRERIQAALQAQGVEFRLWYGAGIDQQTHFSAAPADPLPVTHELASTLLGLPMAADLSEAIIARVIRGVLGGLSRPPAGT
jgi:dTDP-4-amino-4,6-dideoxygalactose transaminase